MSMDEISVRSLLERHWEFAGSKDQSIAHEIYHDDAVLEFPQSGERFIGKERFQAFREKYPANLNFKIRRITGSGDLWVAENLISYDGGPWMFTVNVLRFRGSKVAAEYIYIMEGFERPQWRVEFGEAFDSLAPLD